MADGEYVTIAHQDDVYHKEYAAELLKAAGKWPDMTVFTTDYVITKGGKTITGDRLLWVKRILRLPLRCPAFNGFTWVKRLPLMLGNSICCPATTYHKSLLGEPLVRSEYSYALDWDNLVQLAERPAVLSAVKNLLCTIGFTTERRQRPVWRITGGQRRNGKCLPVSGRSRWFGF